MFVRVNTRRNEKDFLLQGYCACQQKNVILTLETIKSNSVSVPMNIIVKRIYVAF